MRILAVSAWNAERSDLSRLATVAGPSGHDLRSVHVGPRPSGVSARTATLAAKVSKQLLLWRPKAALIELGPTTSAVAPALTAARVPFIVWAPDQLLSLSSEETGTWMGPALGHTCRSAAGVVVGSDAAAEWLSAHAGVSEMELLQRGVDLQQLPLGARAEAKAALGLPPDRPVLGLIADLQAWTRLDLLGFAQRKMPGVALLVAGEGPQEPAIFAMSASTRPSSPVIHVGPVSPATRVLTGCAADVGLALDRRGLGDEAWNLAALGRRQVTFEVPGTDSLAAVYPEHRTVFAAPEDPTALRQVLDGALQEELQQGPLPEAAVLTARAQLDEHTRWTRLLERVAQCA